MTAMNLPSFCPYNRNNLTSPPEILNLMKEADGICKRPENCVECIRNHTDPQPFQKERERIKLTE